MSEDRRQFKRRYLAFYSRVFDVKSHQLLGHVVDITPQGLMLISETPLPADSTFRLEIELPEDFAHKRAILFEARSRWCQADIDPHFHNTGFQLLNIAPDDVEIIQRIVATFGFRDNEQTGA
jgi:hypothetical protein